MPSYTVWIIVAALTLVVCYLLYDRAENRREIRHLRQGNAELLKMRGIHRVPVTPTVSIPDKSLMGAINDSLQPMGTVDFNELYKPF